MKKEVLIAVLIGLSMGLIITYGIYRVQSSLNQPPVTDVAEVTNKNEATDSADTATVLSVHNPSPGTIQTETTTTVTGTTHANVHVVLFVNEEDYIIVSDDSGNFTFDIELDRGTNVLSTHVIDDLGQTAMEERVVVVTDIYEQEATNSATTSATESQSW